MSIRSVSQARGFTDDPESIRRHFLLEGPAEKRARRRESCRALVPLLISVGLIYAGIMLPVCSGFPVTEMLQAIMASAIAVTIAMTTLGVLHTPKSERWHMIRIGVAIGMVFLLVFLALSLVS